MNKNLKKILVPFLLMIIINLGTFYFAISKNFAEGYAPHLGILFISGLLFGPYGALGAVLGNTLCDFIRGYSVGLTITSEVISLFIATLAYKLWYEKFKSRKIITTPKLNGTSEMIVFIGIILLCAAIYSLINKKLFYIFQPETIQISFLVGVRYFINFVNTAFIFGIIGILLSKYIDFIHVPEKYEEKLNEKTYKILGALLVITTLFVGATDFYLGSNVGIMIVEILIIMALLVLYLTKPINKEITRIPYNRIPEKIMNIFLVTSLIILVIGYIVASDEVLITALDLYLPINIDEIMILVFLMMDILFIIYFIPSILVLKYIENNVIDPIVSFSGIEKFIKKGDRIESDGLVKVYSEYINEDDEIGMLARSYTSLINYTNEYIENIHKIEGEKHRIEAELSIAEKIQKSNLPTGSIEKENYSIFGFSQPAKEVGGDFYDYYELDDDNVAIVIGDASGKGIPAAILSTVAQSIIKQLLKSEKDPSKVLYLLNNQICENNSELMFVTLWLGIYNNKTNNLNFSNAGHEAPLIMEDGKFKPLKVSPGIVLGVMEDFEFVKEETEMSKGIIVYTDGITDAKNPNDEFYGEDKLIDFLNSHPFENKIIDKLLKDIDEFTGPNDQFDDMTIVLLDRHD
ncbi:MAG: serine/threonine-protein phosphatase [Methanobrevibacter millerae]|uniref:Serine/threonine-protein phosphatase n=1 Tax=Methanobrevibacter millerae TaxID=230361 RepID=A0A8T3VBG1_9EURY|nr:SpoIIE family protein phosphatase [Methanobrevibacter millerae]MBE6504492.1 serine/threonine-protein phosphatase [Methanobrevibacter millerae]